jgi:hypothetical protein
MNGKLIREITVGQHGRKAKPQCGSVRSSAKIVRILFAINIIKKSENGWPR